VVRNREARLRPSTMCGLHLWPPPVREAGAAGPAAVQLPGVIAAGRKPVSYHQVDLRPRRRLIVAPPEH